MNKKKKRSALKAAAKVVDALKTAGAIPEGAKVEIRVQGQRQKSPKGQSKPR